MLGEESLLGGREEPSTGRLHTKPNASSHVPAAAPNVCARSPCARAGCSHLLCSHLPYSHLPHPPPPPPQVSFLDKNNDTLQEDWLAQLSSSAVPLLQSLFLPGVEAASKANRKAAAFSSVGKRFVNDLNSLLAELKASKAHFVRCVKPSASSTPRAFEGPLVLDQLRCAGVVEAVRVMTEVSQRGLGWEVGLR